MGSLGAELSVPDSGLHLSRDLVLRVIQLLSNESRALTVCVANLQCAISTLTGRRMVVDSLLHALLRSLGLL